MIKSRYCRGVFIISFIVGYLLIPRVLFSRYALLVLIFTTLFAFNVTCIIYHVKERVRAARFYKRSIWGIVASAVGLSVLQICGIGTPMCGASIGLGVFSTLFPHIIFPLVQQYGPYLIVISIILQIASLYSMKCFPKLLPKKFKTPFP